MTSPYGSDIPIYRENEDVPDDASYMDYTITHTRTRAHIHTHLHTYTQIHT